MQSRRIVLVTQHEAKDADGREYPVANRKGEDELKRHHEGAESDGLPAECPPRSETTKSGTRSMQAPRLDGLASNERSPLLLVLSVPLMLRWVPRNRLWKSSLTPSQSSVSFPSTSRSNGLE